MIGLCLVSQRTNQSTADDHVIIIIISCLGLGTYLSDAQTSLESIPGKTVYSQVWQS